jgi:hypothetical protein
VRACGVADIARHRGELSEVDELTQAGLEVGRMPQLMFMPAGSSLDSAPSTRVTANRSVAFICEYGINSLRRSAQIGSVRRDGILREWTVVLVSDARN